MASKESTGTHWGILAKAVGKFYFEPKKRDIHDITFPRQVKETVWTEQQVEKVIREKGSLTSTNIVVFIVGNAIGLLFLLLLPPLGLAILLLANLMGFIIKSQNLVERKVVEVVRIPQEVMREVQDAGESKPGVIRPGERIRSLRRIGVPFKAVGFDGNQSILVGPDEMAETKTLSFPSFPKHYEVARVMAGMDETFARVPYILDGEKGAYAAEHDTHYGEALTLRGYEKNLQDKFIELSELFASVMPIPIPIKVILAKGLASVLRPVENPNKDDPWGVSATSVGVQILKEYLESEEGDSFEAKAKDWLVKWQRHHAVLHGVRFASLGEQVAPICLDLNKVLNYSAFNFYCPACNDKGIEELLGRSYSIQINTPIKPLQLSRNTRCHYIPEKSAWKCPTCESETLIPIPIHKSLDEILLPAYDQLMNENKTERLKTHSDTQSKEMSYTNNMDTEVEKAYYEHVSHLHALTENLERLKAEIMGENEAIKSIREVAAMHEAEESKVLAKIEEYSQKTNLQIQENVNRAMKSVDDFTNTTLNAYHNEMQRFARAQRLEDEARDRTQREILFTQKEHVQVAREAKQAMQEGFSKVSSDIQAGTVATVAGLQQINQAVGRGNAISAAVAKKQGLDIRDYNPLFQPLRAIKDFTIGVGGALTGQDSIAIEGEKLENV